VGLTYPDRSIGDAMLTNYRKWAWHLKNFRHATHAMHLDIPF